MIPRFLSGVRFTDLTWAGAGSFGTKIFADFGADVLKIESASRLDPVRLGGPFKDRVRGTNRSGYFASRNTGKKSVSIDLKHPKGIALVKRLICKSDVVSNNFGPGAMERLGLGYDAVKALKPDIIYLSMPMYGDEGPNAQLLGVGMTISAVAGLMMHTAYKPDDFVGPGTHYPDHAANPYHAAFAVIAALRHRQRSGEGTKVDLSQVESTINFVGPAIVEASASGVEPQQVGNRSPHDAPHNIFQCLGDDAWCAIAVHSDESWVALTNAVGRSDLAADAKFRNSSGRLAAISYLEEAIATWTSTKTMAQVVSILSAAGVAVAAVSSSRDLIETDPQLAARGFWERIEHPEMGETLYTAPPYKIDGSRVELKRPPLLGEHTDEVLHEILGIDREEIDSLRQEGALT